MENSGGNADASSRGVNQIVRRATQRHRLQTPVTTWTSREFRRRQSSSQKGTASPERDFQPNCIILYSSKNLKMRRQDFSVSFPVKYIFSFFNGTLALIILRYMDCKDAIVQHRLKYIFTNLTA